MTTPVTWFELTGTDTAALRTFYADLFGWEITPVDGMDYGIVAPATAASAAASRRATAPPLSCTSRSTTSSRPRPRRAGGGQDGRPRDRDPRHGHVRPVRRPRGQRRRPDAQLTAVTATRCGGTAVEADRQADDMTTADRITPDVSPEPGYGTFIP